MGNLTAEFEQGRAARVSIGRLMQHGDKPACPYYDSSPAGDAWQAGYAFQCDRWAGNEIAAMPVRRAWHGRGYSVNVELDAKGAPRLSYLVEFSPSGTFARLAA